MMVIWVAVVSAWIAFFVGFVCGILWLDHRSKRRIRQDLWRQIHSVSAGGKWREH